MSKKNISQERRDRVSRSIHRQTIAMALVILVCCIMILPWSDPSQAAFVPLILSMVISLFTLIWAMISLRRQVKEEMAREKEDDESPGQGE
jgi:protein-S-isoprenylcysteine O-methyltransferase Ste14